MRPEAQPSRDGRAPAPAFLEYSSTGTRRCAGTTKYSSVLCQPLDFGLDMFESIQVFLGLGERLVKKQYIVRLTDEERNISDGTIDKLKGTGENPRRARILRQVEADGPNWADRPVAEAFRSRTRTVENIRRRCVPEAFRSRWSGASGRPR